MKWSEPQKADGKVSLYEHVICDTPLGRCKIEWKSWKKSDSYSVTVENDYVGEGNDLDDAKKLAEKWLSDKRDALIEFLNPKHDVVGRIEQFYCTCSRAKGLDHDEEGMPYCIECQKPVQ